IVNYHDLLPTVHHCLRKHVKVGARTTDTPQDSNFGITLPLRTLLWLHSAKHLHTTLSGSLNLWLVQRMIDTRSYFEPLLYHNNTTWLCVRVWEKETEGP